MKKRILRFVSITMCVVMLFTSSMLGTNAAQPQEVNTQAITDTVMKGLYNTLNVVVEGLVKTICTIYLDPNDWQHLDNYDADEIGFMPAEKHTVLKLQKVLYGSSVMPRRASCPKTLTVASTTSAVTCSTSMPKAYTMTSAYA